MRNDKQNMLKPSLLASALGALAACEPITAMPPSAPPPPPSGFQSVMMPTVQAQELHERSSAR